MDFRDRAVDETGGQITVFGRLGSRPFNRSEMERLFLTQGGLLYHVRDRDEALAGGDHWCRRLSGERRARCSWG